jgi:hypothetical protein
MRADELVGPEPQMAKRIGGSEDLVFELGGDPTPLARLRPVSGPPSVQSRVESIERMREPGQVREGYTHRERAVLWGTSLAHYQAQVQELPDSSSFVRSGFARRRRRRAEGGAYPEEVGNSTTAKSTPTCNPPNEDYHYETRLQMFRARVLDALVSGRLALLHDSQAQKILHLPDAASTRVGCTCALTRMVCARTCVCNKDRRQRTDKGVIEQCEATWKAAGLELCLMQARPLSLFRFTCLHVCPLTL